MLKKITIIAFLFLFVNNIYSQIVKGYCIYNNGDTADIFLNNSKGLFKTGISIESLQYRVKFYDSNNLKKILKPYMAKEISFILNGERIRMLSRQMPSGRILFIQLISDGKLKLFKVYKTRQTVSGGGMYGAPMVSGSYTVEKYYLQKNDEELFKPLGISFRKEMMLFLSDCPNLAKKIEQKVFSIENLEHIVYEYNETCR